MRILACLFVLTVAVCASAKPIRPGPAEEKAKPDQELIQGDWIVTSVVKDNDNVPQEKLDRTVFTFKGNEITINEVRPNAPPHIEKVTFKLDPTKKPKQIEIQPIDPNGGNGPSVPGIYELDGNTLRICAGGPGQPRPTEFTTKSGVLTFRRKTP